MAIYPEIQLPSLLVYSGGHLLRFCGHVSVLPWSYNLQPFASSAISLPVVPNSPPLAGSELTFPNGSLLCPSQISRHGLTNPFWEHVVTTLIHTYNIYRSHRNYTAWLMWTTKASAQHFLSGVNNQLWGTSLPCSSIAIHGLLKIQIYHCIGLRISPLSIFLLICMVCLDHPLIIMVIKMSLIHTNANYLDNILKCQIPKKDNHICSGFRHICNGVKFYFQASLEAEIF